MIDEIRVEAVKAANRSQFLSNYPYDHKSYEDGFYEGAKNPVSQQSVIIKFLDWLEEVSSNSVDRGWTEDYLKTLK